MDLKSINDYIMNRCPDFPFDEEGVEKYIRCISPDIIFSIFPAIIFGDEWRAISNSSKDPSPKKIEDAKIACVKHNIKIPGWIIDDDNLFCYFIIYITDWISHLIRWKPSRR